MERGLISGDAVTEQEIPAYDTVRDRHCTYHTAPPLRSSPFGQDYASSLRSSPFGQDYASPAKAPAPNEAIFVGQYCMFIGIANARTSDYVGATNPR